MTMHVARLRKSVTKSIDFRDDEFDEESWDSSKSLRDGRVEKDGRGLVVDSIPFKETRPSGSAPGLDNAKWAVTSHDSITLKRNSEYVFEVKLAVQQTFKERVPFPPEFRSRIRNMFTDPRLACSMFSVSDGETGLVFGLVLTNQVVYAFYARYPKISTPEPQADVYREHGDIFYGRPKPNRRIEDPTEVSFANFVELAQRYGNEPSESFVRGAISINTLSEHVSWLIDDKVCFTIAQPGLRLSERYRAYDNGGPSSPLFPKRVKYGFGNYSFLDLTLPDNYARDYVEGANRLRSALVRLQRHDYYRNHYANMRGEIHPIDAGYFAVEDDHPGKRLFGQGSMLVIKKIKIVRYKLTRIGEHGKREKHVSEDPPQHNGFGEGVVMMPICPGPFMGGPMIQPENEGSESNQEET